MTTIAAQTGTGQRTTAEGSTVSSPTRICAGEGK
jgi:hypothetical protein